MSATGVPSAATPRAPQCLPGWVSSYGMNAYLTVLDSLTVNPLPFQCACWKPKNIATLITISATVITGKRRVGMLSLSGSKPA